MKTQRNVDNDRLTIRIDPELKKEMVEVANRLDVSLAWIIKRAWKLSKESFEKLAKT